MKRVHTLPIYSKIGYLPELSIYALADTPKSSYWYIGEGNAVQRYKKYLRAVAGNDYTLNDGREKLNHFRASYQEGISPVMIVLKEAENKEQARVLEKQYRELYTSKNHPLINKTGKRKPYKKDLYHKRIYGIADWFYENWMLVFFLAGITGLGTFVLLRSHVDG